MNQTSKVIFNYNFHCVFSKANHFHVINKYTDPVGLEDSDVLNEEDKIRKTNLDTLFKSERLVVR